MDMAVSSRNFSERNLTYFVASGWFPWNYEGKKWESDYFEVGEKNQWPRNLC